MKIVLISALDANDTTAARIQHDILTDTYVALCMSWPSALLELILMISPALANAIWYHGGPKQDIDGMATENAVQFSDVSSHTAVVDAPVLPIESVHVVNQPVPATVEQPVPPTVVEKREADNCDSSSKSGRFGRILHL